MTGFGTIDGRQVGVFSQDFTVFGGSLGEAFAEKMVKLMDLAEHYGCPIIGINDSAGARIQEGVEGLAGYGEVFFRNVRASGVVPQISIIAGPCAGGAVYSPAMTDFIFMVEGTSQMFITGPDVIKTVTGETVTHEQLGGADTHTRISGVAHFAAADEDELNEQVRRAALVHPVEQSRRRAPRSRRTTTRRGSRRRSTRSCPEVSTKPYDMHEVLAEVLDDGDFLEVQAAHAGNILIGFGRLDGHTVGIVANQPTVLAGTLDIDASIKGGPLRALLRRLQYPAGRLRGCARLPARDRSGVPRHHPPWLEAALRLCRSDRAESYSHHAQGLRRRLRRDELEAYRRRFQRCLANCRDRGDGLRRGGATALPARIGCRADDPAEPSAS